MHPGFFGWWKHHHASPHAGCGLLAHGAHHDGHAGGHEARARRGFGPFGGPFGGAPAGGDDFGAGLGVRRGLRFLAHKRVRDAVQRALTEIHAVLDDEQRRRLAYLLRTGMLTI